MKLIILSLRLTLCTALFSVLSSLLYSQGNLQFNQVKKVSVLETVPINKVWKIEGFVYGSSLPNFSGINTDQIIASNDNVQIDGIQIIVRSLRGAMGAYGGGKEMEIWQINYPIWLNYGSTLAASSGVQFISVIEFNIIP
jgi:hypothetical protein